MPTLLRIFGGPLNCKLKNGIYYNTPLMNGAQLLNPIGMLLRYPMRYPHMQVSVTYRYSFLGVYLF